MFFRKKVMADAVPTTVPPKQPSSSGIKPLAKDEFFQAAENYIGELGQTHGFSEIVKLWRRTDLPYRMESTDPFSDEYRAEILSIYQRLAHDEYNVANEWTSNKQDPEQFERGYPWVSGNFSIIAEEIAKPIQVLRILSSLGKSDISAIEFGSGWGNLSIPLAKAGVNMTLVDIDQGFLDRTMRIATREQCQIQVLCGDFLEIAQQDIGKFDVVIFQSSFHHCLEFQELLNELRKNVLGGDGVILFVNEPIHSELGFPWGLRHDGESLWAIMCNKWLELGFHTDFFLEMLLRNGFLTRRCEPAPAVYGEGWIASYGETGLPFSQVALPGAHDASFHQADGTSPGRFTGALSTLPALPAKAGLSYHLHFVNHSLKPLRFSISTGTGTQSIELASGTRTNLVVPGDELTLTIASDTFIPVKQGSSGDTRRLGIYLERVAVA